MGPKHKRLQTAKEIDMFIVVQHDITNKDAFFGSAKEVVEGVPQGIKAVQFLPSTDSAKAVCLWEGKSVEDVKNYLEPKIGKIARNTYYGVDGKVAIGLPAGMI
jgi:hypothetical protein